MEQKTVRSISQAQNQQALFTQSFPTNGAISGPLIAVT